MSALLIFKVFVLISLVLSFLESNSPGILTFCETNLEDTVDSSSFSVRGYCIDLHFMQLKRREVLCHMSCPLKTLRILDCILDWLWLIQCLNSFSSFGHYLFDVSF